MEIKIDEKQILKEVLEFDKDIHQKIKDKITDRLVNNLVNKIETEFIDKKWSGTKEIWNRVLETIKEKQEEMTKEILRKFYDGYRFGKKDITILKKLKELLEEE